ncbi:unnamed protein product [Paramecium primaurelia]|uniref:Uncharacterized protein n=1 Tax=Paramecium primaurelia TaxID=5886 RepID=A0A8S1MBH8_PARPR|nr:unnamed protein product [Paramecium primaurelia]
MSIKIRLKQKTSIKIQINELQVKLQGQVFIIFVDDFGSISVQFFKKIVFQMGFDFVFEINLVLERMSQNRLESF